MNRIEFITQSIVEMGITPVLAAKMAAIIVREDITFEEKRELLDNIAGR